MILKKTILLLILQLTLITSALANKDDIRDLLGPYPASGSFEEQQDFQQLLNFQNNRTAAQCQQAKKEEIISLRVLFAGENGPLNKFEVFQFTPLFLMLQIKTLLYSRTAKNIFKRPRPYLTNPKIVPCVKREKSYAYPSGHTVMARYAAKIFAAIFPARAKAFMRRADEVAVNRILGGVHHPSDIVAGKKLGDALATQFMQDQALY